MGDLVYKLDLSTKVGQSKKLRPIYLGPFLIVEVNSPILNIIEGRKKISIGHHGGLKPLP